MDPSMPLGIDDFEFDEVFTTVSVSGSRFEDQGLVLKISNNSEMSTIASIDFPPHVLGGMQGDVSIEIVMTHTYNASSAAPSIAPVIAISIYDADGVPLRVEKLSTPIKITIPFYRHARMKSRSGAEHLRCVYRDVVRNEWRHEGLRIGTVAENSTVCETSHLTEFTLHELVREELRNSLECSNIKILTLEAFGRIPYKLLAAFAGWCKICVDILLVAFYMLVVLKAKRDDAEQQHPHKKTSASLDHLLNRCRNRAGVRLMLQVHPLIKLFASENQSSRQATLSMAIFSSRNFGSINV